MTEHDENAQETMDIPILVELKDDETRKTADEFQAEMDRLQQKIDELTDELQAEMDGHKATMDQHKQYVKEAEAHAEQLALQLDQLREADAEAELEKIAQEEARRVALTWDDQPLNDGPAFAGSDFDPKVRTAFVSIDAKREPVIEFEGTFQRVEEPAEGVWEIQTLIQRMDPATMDHEDEELADFLNEDWEIINLTVVSSGSPMHFNTRYITLGRLNEDDERGDRGDDRAPAPVAEMEIDDESEGEGVDKPSTEALLTGDYVNEAIGQLPDYDEYETDFPDFEEYDDSEMAEIIAQLERVTE